MGLKVDSYYLNIMIRLLKPIVAVWGCFLPAKMDDETLLA
jgi:hypothetical protein